MLSGMNWKDSFDDMKRKFWPVYKVSIILCRHLISTEFT